MSGTPTNWSVVDNAEDWFRQQEKRGMHEARRPRVTSASDLLGPGFAPFAVPLLDWNAPETNFNGFFFSEPGAANSPDNTKTWIGLVIVTPTGHGLQQVWSHDTSGSAPLHYVRTSHTHVLEMTSYSAWAAV